MVGEDVEPQSQPPRHMVAERRAFTGLRDGEEMPLICPTCQLAFEVSTPAACYFAWGCFRYFGSAHLRRGDPELRCPFCAKTGRAFASPRRPADASKAAFSIA